MGKVQVLRLSNKHQEILEYMIANPTEKLGDVALRHRVTPAWLSTLVHSDAFQEELRKKRGEVFLPAMMGVRERLTGMAHLVLDKVEENLENDKFTPGQLLEVQDDVLDRLGYGAPQSGHPTPGVTINNYGNAPSSTVAQARERWMNVQRVDDEPEPEADDELGEYLPQAGQPTEDIEDDETTQAPADSPTPEGSATGGNSGGG